LSSKFWKKLKTSGFWEVSAYKARSLQPEAYLSPFVKYCNLITRQDVAYHNFFLYCLAQI